MLKGMATVSATTDFRDKLEAELARRGWTQQELARRSGVHFVTINRILRSSQTPTIDVAERLAKAVGLGLPNFFKNAS